MKSLPTSKLKAQNLIIFSLQQAQPPATQDTDGDNERTAEIAQEDEENTDGDQTAGNRAVRHVVDGTLNVF